MLTYRAHRDLQRELWEAPERFPCPHCGELVMSARSAIRMILEQDGISTAPLVRIYVSQAPAARAPHPQQMHEDETKNDARD